jgi:6-phosphofructokinase 1
MDSSIRRVAILFAGGPAPAANAVISTAAVSFLRNNIEVIGVLNGYSHLIEYAPDHPLQEGRDYIKITHKTLKRTRNSQGILIGTARANPGKMVSSPDHLKDPQRSAPLKTVYEALVSLNVDALISIGGDDTLKTANKFKLFQEQLPPGSRHIPVVHLPKTIDNDYSGIDFTFGYFTAVETLAEEVRNLLADAEANRAYFIAEAMGRSAGWLAYGVAIAGEASLVISVEDITGKYEKLEETVDAKTGVKSCRRAMNIEEVVRRIVATMRVREEAEGKEFGVIVLAEGLAELLPQQHIEGVPRDEHGHIAVSQLNLSRLFSDLVSKEYARQTGKKRKITGLPLGYESRCARPLAFDVMLGSQLGVGAYRALVEKRLDGVMVSTTGQLELLYVPFEKLVDPKTLVTVVRYIAPGSDFHRLARFLETYVNE